MRFIKPLDEALLKDIFKTYDTIVTVENGTKHGGFGSAVLEFAAQHNYKNTIYIKGIPDEFIEHGSTEELQKEVELDADSLKTFILSL